MVFNGLILIRYLKLPSAEELKNGADLSALFSDETFSLSERAIYEDLSGYGNSIFDMLDTIYRPPDSWGKAAQFFYSPAIPLSWKIYLAPQGEDTVTSKRKRSLLSRALELRYSREQIWSLYWSVSRANSPVRECLRSNDPETEGDANRKAALTALCTSPKVYSSNELVANLKEFIVELSEGRLSKEKLAQVKPIILKEPYEILP